MDKMELKEARNSDKMFHGSHYISMQSTLLLAVFFDKLRLNDLSPMAPLTFPAL